MLEALKVSLCSPACTNPLSDDDESTQGVRGTWMRDFMREADLRNYRIDYICVHWYGGPSPRSFKEPMIQVDEEHLSLNSWKMYFNGWNLRTGLLDMHGSHLVKMKRQEQVLRSLTFKEI
jgi:hypothetical protein